MRTSSFVAQDHPVRSRAVDQAECYWGVAWVRDEALPFDNENLVVLVREREFFDGAVEEVGNHAIHGATVAFDKNPCLSRGDELGIAAAFLECPCDFDGHHHLAATAILPDGEDP